MRYRVYGDEMTADSDMRFSIRNNGSVAEAEDIGHRLLYKGK